MSEPTRALVLAGGGVTGIAWELGLLIGLQEAGVDLTNADLVVGTSAGATVAAQITSGTPLAEFEEAQRRPVEETAEIFVPFDRDRYLAELAKLAEGAVGAEETRARVGRMALDAETVPEAVRRAVIASRLSVHDWPDRPLAITAVDAESGAWVTFQRESGVCLVDAVAASSAVPGIWPPVTIGGRRYIDGGVRSLTNADIPVGYERVAVLVPIALPGDEGRQLDAELRSLGPRSSSLVASANAASMVAMGPNPLDPSRRAPALRAGRRRAGTLAPLLRSFWG